MKIKKIFFTFLLCCLLSVNTIIPVSGAFFGEDSEETKIELYIPNNTGLPAPADGIAQIIENILFWLLSLIGVVAVIGFVISGIQYILASGNESMAEAAKRNMKYSIIGVTVALGAYVIIQAIDYALQGEFF